MTSHDLVDITIIGGGPTGLFAMFYAGMRGASAQIIDALPQLGGQLTALYPEKYIFDVAGYPKVLAKESGGGAREQSRQFGRREHLNQGSLDLRSGRSLRPSDRPPADYPTRAIVIAAGIGAFSPRRLPQRWRRRGTVEACYDVVLDPEEFRGKRVIIIGGGDSAFDWAQQLTGRATHVTLAHRSDRFRAHSRDGRGSAAFRGRGEGWTSSPSTSCTMC